MPRREKVHPEHRGVYVVTLADGSVQYHLRIAVGGVQQRIKFSSLDAALARRAELQGLSAAVRRERQPNKRIDEEFLRNLLLYLQHHREDHTNGDLPNLAESTIHGYAKTIDYHLARWATTHRWSATELTLGQLRDFCQHVGQNGNAAYTNAAKICQVLGRSLVELRFRDDNPASGLPARAERRSTRTSRTRRANRDATGSELWIPTSEQIDRILESVPGQLHVLWFRLLAHTGLRPEEAAGLRWDRDVDLEGRTIRPNEPLVEVNGKRILLGVDVNDPDAAERIDQARANLRAAGKSPRWLRAIPIIDQLLPTLHVLETEFRGDQPWVFPGRRTAKARDSALGSFPISYEVAQTVFRKAAHEAGFDGVRQYDLRHHLVAQLVQAGMSYELIAKILGNSATTVEKAYAHLRRSDLEELQGQMSAAFQP